MTITVLTSVTGHMGRHGIFNCLLSLLILYSLCLQQAPQLVMVLYLVEGPKPSFLKGLGYSSSWILLW